MLRNLLTYCIRALAFLSLFPFLSNFFIPAFAQTLPPHLQTRARQLQIQVSQTHKATEKIDALIALSILFEGNATDSVRHYAQRAESLALQTDGRPGMGRIKFQRGIVDLLQGSPATAIQQLESAMRAFEAQKDSHQVAMVQLRMALAHLDVGRRETAAELIGQAGRSAHMRNDLPVTVEVAYVQSRLKLQAEGLEPALTTLLSALGPLQRIPAEAKDLRLQRRQAGIVYSIGSMYASLGKLDSASKALVYAAQAFAQLGNVQGLARAYHGLSNVMIDVRDFRRAKEYARQALAIHVERRECERTAHAWYQIALVHRYAGDIPPYVAALHHAVDTVSACSGAGDWSGAIGRTGGLVYSELATWYMEQDDWAQSARYFREAEKYLKEDIKNSQNPDMKMILVPYKVQIGAYGEAEEMLEAARKLMRHDQSIYLRVRYFFCAALLHEARGEFQEGMAVMREWKTLEDSVNNIQMAATVKSTEAKYEVAVQKQQLLEKQLESAALQKDLDAESYRLQLWVIGSLGAAAVFILLMFVFRYRAAHRKQQLQAAEAKAEAEKAAEALRRKQLQKRIAELERQALQAQMNPHFIFNCLTALQAFIVANDNRKAEQFLHRFSRLVRNTLRDSRTSSVALSDSMDRLKAYLDLEQMRIGERLQYAFNVAADLEPDLVRIPTMMIQPFVENAVLHGVFPKEGAGRVEIGFRETAGMLNVEIRDDGIGREARKQQQARLEDGYASLGMEITRERLQLVRVQDGDPIEISDLYARDGRAAGTLVRLAIPILN